MLRRCSALSRRWPGGGGGLVACSRRRGGGRRCNSGSPVARDREQLKRDVIWIKRKFAAAGLILLACALSYWMAATSMNTYERSLALDPAEPSVPPCELFRKA
eukprot:TRINITY_DN3251_c0_g1_i1.p3 TRINITY_DN3251_c0_g1~~TRINITY_DN3251_c0_g1_i1.p3  ORF type:complete len:103 (+),score=21.27 TRINITY_DN3251_c0_g1_i1:84-392(+)